METRASLAMSFGDLEFFLQRELVALARDSRDPLFHRMGMFKGEPSLPPTLASRQLSLVADSSREDGRFRRIVAYREDTWPHSVLQIDADGTTTVVQCWLKKAALWDDLTKGWESAERIELGRRRGGVSLMAKTRGSPFLISAGIAGVPFEPGNYTDEAVAGYEKARAELSSETPAGRLVILNGPTGTGKTYLVRGLMDAVDAHFVFIPAGLFRELDGPELVTVLIEEHRDGGRPTVLIVEDADLLLRKRSDDRLSEISTLLNLTSGILGDVLDIRVVCTANLEREEMDEALIRANRLAVRVQVDRLPVDKSVAFLQRMLDASTSASDLGIQALGLSLADLFAMVAARKA